MTNRSLRAKRQNLGYTLSSQNATSRALRLAGRRTQKEDEEELPNKKKTKIMSKAKATLTITQTEKTMTLEVCKTLGNGKRQHIVLATVENNDEMVESDKNDEIQQLECTNHHYDVDERISKSARVTKTNRRKTISNSDSSNRNSEDCGTVVINDDVVESNKNDEIQQLERTSTNRHNDVDEQTSNASHVTKTKRRQNFSSLDNNSDESIVFGMNDDSTESEDDEEFLELEHTNDVNDSNHNDKHEQILDLQKRVTRQGCAAI